MSNPSSCGARSAFRPLRPRILLLVIRSAGLIPMTGLFAAWFVLATVVVAAVEPGIAGLGDAAWFLFTVVTTIGLGDYTCATILGRVATVSLSVYSVFYLALITGAVVSFCNEVMMARRDEGAAAIVDQLEHLEELDRDELAALSARVRALTRQQH